MEIKKIKYQNTIEFTLIIKVILKGKTIANI